MKMEHIGYVAGITYNSEGTLLEWLYGNNGELCGYNKHPKKFKTKDQAGRFLMKRMPCMGSPYVRAYYYEY